MYLRHVTKSGLNLVPCYFGPVLFLITLILTKILGELINRVEEMEREDVVKVLRAGCSIYRIITLEESMSLPVVESDDSLLIQQNAVEQQQKHEQNGASSD